MNPLWGHIAGVLIVLMMLAFIGIWIWAWLPRHKRSFGALSRLPMEDEPAGMDGRVPPTRAEDRR